MVSAYARLPWHPTTGFFIALWIGLLWAGHDRMLRDPGTLWHPVVGQQILQTGRLPRTDPFSFTEHGQTWIDQQWLGNCFMAIVHRIAGLDGLILATATLLAGLLAWLAGRFMRAGLQWPAAALLLMLVIAASSYHFIPRPHLATLLFLAWTLALLCDVEAGRASPWRLLLLPPVFVLWTNIHGGVLGGIATTVFVLSAWLLRLRRPSALNKSAFAGPILIATALSLSFVAILINPYGPSLPRSWLSLMSSDLLPKLIIEHAPLSLVSIEGWMILLLAAVYLGLLMRVWRNGVRITWLVPMIWLVLAFTRIRHGPLFAVTAAIAIADMLTECKPAMANWKVHAPTAHRPNAKSSLLNPVAIPAVLVILALTLQTTGIRCPIIGAGWARLNPRYWPVKATTALCDFMATPASTISSATSAAGDHPLSMGPSKANTPQSSFRIFNDLLYGGYLIYRVPEARIYIDDRCELYRDDGLKRYVELQRHPERFAGLAAYHDIRLAMVHTRSPLDDYLAGSHDWTTVHRDATASVYYRNSSH